MEEEKGKPQKKDDTVMEFSHENMKDIALFKKSILFIHDLL